MLLNEAQKQFRKTQTQAGLIQQQQQQIDALELRLSRIKSMLLEAHTGANEVAGMVRSSFK
jgi:hypothetical protein